MNGKGIVQTVLLLAVATLPARVSAQTDTRGAAAAAVVNQAFAAHERMEWGRLVQLIHPAALARMHTENLRMLRDIERSRSEPQPRDSTMPEAVARWFEQQRQQHIHIQDDAWSLAGLGVASIKEAEALSLEEFMIRLLKAQDPRTIMMKQVKRLRPNLPDSVFRNEQFPITRRTTVGSVVESDSIVYVLYRERFQASDVAQLVVATLRRSADAWRLWPEGFQLFGQGNFSVVHAVEEHAQEIEKLAEQVVTWPSGAVPAGRALLSGFAKDATGAKVLIVESDGQRVRVPLTVFEKLLQVLSITYMVAK
jgi:hypothetical protein